MGFWGRAGKALWAGAHTVPFVGTALTVGEAFFEDDDEEEEED